MQQNISSQGSTKKPKRLIHPLFSIGAALVLIVSRLLPPDGVFLTICGFKILTGLPCPGCGLTRSVINLSHLHFALSFRLHPLGMAVYLMSIFLILYGCIPEKTRIAVDEMLLRNRKLLNTIGIIAVFLLAGIWIFRLIAVYWLRLPCLQRL